MASSVYGRLHDRINKFDVTVSVLRSIFCFPDTFFARDMHSFVRNFHVVFFLTSSSLRILTLFAMTWMSLSNKSLKAIRVDLQMFSTIFA